MRAQTERRWVLAGGGTGGHVTMALALAETIAETGDTLLFLGTSDGLEATLVPEAGFELETIPARPVMGQKRLAGARALVGLLRSTRRALVIFTRVRPQIVVSLGGYVAVPAVLAAALRRIPVAVVEPNAIAGRANRLTGRVARRIFVGFERTAAAFASGRVRVSGVPLRKALVRAFASPTPRRSEVIPFRLLVFGGSQGARQINDAMIDALADLDSGRFEIVHQTGVADRDRVAESYARAGFRAEVIDFQSTLWHRYAWADLAVCRSGAISVAELCVAGLPALLVPYPYAADDHQAANALELAEAGAARVLDPRAFDGKVLAKAVISLLEDPEALAEMRERAATQGRPDASCSIVAECRALLDASSRGN